MVSRLTSKSATSKLLKLNPCLNSGSSSQSDGSHYSHENVSTRVWLASRLSHS